MFHLQNIISYSQTETNCSTIDLGQLYLRTGVTDHVLRVSSDKDRLHKGKDRWTVCLHHAHLPVLPASIHPCCEKIIL